jgi:hypothetical protein
MNILSQSAGVFLFFTYINELTDRRVRMKKKKVVDLHFQAPLTCPCRLLSNPGIIHCLG